MELIEKVQGILELLDVKKDAKFIDFLANLYEEHLLESGNEPKYDLETIIKDVLYWTSD